jgi:hypothetical protein
MSDLKGNELTRLNFKYFLLKRAVRTWPSQCWSVSLKQTQSMPSFKISNIYVSLVRKERYSWFSSAIKHSSLCGINFMQTYTQNTWKGRQTERGDVRGVVTSATLRGRRSNLMASRSMRLPYTIWTEATNRQTARERERETDASHSQFKTITHLDQHFPLCLFPLQTSSCELSQFLLATFTNTHIRTRTQSLCLSVTLRKFLRWMLFCSLQCWICKIRYM